MYLRQVDVPGVDTKFIGRHKGVLTDQSPGIARAYIVENEVTPRAVGTRTNPTAAALDLLDPAEQSLYRDLVAAEFGRAVRLEQERISFAAIEQALAALSTSLAAARTARVNWTNHRLQPVYCLYIRDGIVCHPGWAPRVGGMHAGFLCPQKCRAVASRPCLGAAGRDR
jgi:hypothetical protein